VFLLRRDFKNKEKCMVNRTLIGRLEAYLAEIQVQLITRIQNFNGKNKWVDVLDEYEIHEGMYKYSTGSGVGMTEEAAVEDFARFISNKTIISKKDRRQSWVVPDFVGEL
jgi:hypothetical protein